MTYETDLAERQAKPYVAVEYSGADDETGRIAFRGATFRECVIKAEAAGKLESVVLYPANSEGAKAASHESSAEELAPVFSVFSCIGFRRAFIGRRGEKTERWPMGTPIHELYETGAYRGATEAWDAFRREPREVFADIERRGSDWHLDVITNAGHDAWYSARYPSLETAYRALQWLSRDDWQALRSKSPERNTARRLTDAESAELAAYAGATSL
jgi:hypothetical protein